MARLTNFQWETIYEGTLRILRAETIDAFAQESLGCLAALIPAKQHMLFTFDRYVPGNVEFGKPYVYGTSVHLLDVFLDGPYMDEDWIFNRMNLKSSDCAYRDSDIIDEEDLVNLRVYKDIYQRDGVHYGLRINMTASNSLRGSYSIFRAKEEGDFTDQELEACNRIAPIFAARYRQLLSACSSNEEQTGLTRSEAMDRFGLTVREYQVAEMIAKGLTDEEAAERLCVGISTVRKHLYNAYAKLAVNKRSQLEELFGINRR